MDETVLDAVRAKLRAGGIKLWLPPYIVDGARSDAAMISLLPLLQGPAGAPVAEEASLLQALHHLQNHALQKLLAKASPPAQDHAWTATLKVKVVGANVPSPSADGERHNSILLSAIPGSRSWEHVAALILQALSTAGSKPAESAANNTSEAGPENSGVTLRLIVRGRLIHGDAMTTSVGSHLSSQASQTHHNVIAIIKPQGTEKPTAEQRGDPILERARKIRDAAALIAGRLDGDFDLTDQHGRPVPLPARDRGSLCAALSLHALGKEVLQGKLARRTTPEARSDANDAAIAADGKEDGREGATAGEEASAFSGSDKIETDSDGQPCSEQVAEALAVLLEADTAWSQVPEIWQERVDNFGLLQMDIAWCLLQLENLHALPDAATRISRTEKVLMTQVNPNFLKLAIMHAEEGRAVPPLAAPFVRLLLLKGVIKLGHERDVTGAIVTLQEAQALCRALVVDPGAMSELLRLGASPESAVVALRKAAGDVQRAASEILDQVDKASQAKQDRSKQRALGLTANHEGYVDLRLISTAQDFLAVDHDVAVALLRLSNNNIDLAVQAWQDADRQREPILQRARAISRPKQRKRKEPGEQNSAAPSQAVDEMALVTLLSTGIDRDLAEAALRSAAGKAGDPVEAAIAWLNGVPDNSAAGTGEGGEEGKGRGKEQMSDAGSEEESSNSCDTDSEKLVESAQEEGVLHEEAYELLQRELGGALQKSDLAEQHLGLTLHEERAMIDKYLSLALSQTPSGAAVR